MDVIDKNVKEAFNKNVVCIIDPVGRKAGLDFYNDSLAEFITQSGRQTKVFSNYVSDFSEKTFRFQFGSSILYIPHLIFSYLAILKQLTKNKPKTVILHLFAATKISNWFARHLKKLNIQIIFIVHDIESLVEKKTSGVEMNKSLILADEIVVHNEFSKSELAKKYSFADSKTTAIPHGNFVKLPSDLSREESRLKLNLGPNEKVILFFGMIKPSKGLDVLLKSMQNVNAKLIVAGRMRKHSIDNYHNLLTILKDTGKLQLDIGYVTNVKRDLYFKACDLIVLPYHKVYQSGVLIMAMSYGLPVIASDLASNIELVKNKECIDFFPEGDHLRLTERISNLLENFEHKKLIAENAFKLMESSHRWEDVAQQFNNLMD